MRPGGAHRSPHFPRRSLGDLPRRYDSCRSRLPGAPAGDRAVRVAYFTAGTVGAGHHVRGLALERGLGRAGYRGEFRVFGPALPFAADPQGGRRETVAVESDPLLRDPRAAPASRLAAQLRDYAPDLLLVDLFWAPLRWILSSLDCEAWLLVRLCPPHWLTGPPGLPFDPGQYGRIVAIEPLPERGARGAVRGIETIDPVVVCNPEERRSAGALRERLGVAPGEELKVVVHAGRRGEVEELAAAAGAGAAVLDLYAPGAPFPAAEWLGGADGIWAGAGYNAVWEARWLGYAARTRWTPFRRSIDDQALRLELAPESAPRRNGADTLAGWIVEGGAA